MKFAKTAALLATSAFAANPQVESPRVTGYPTHGWGNVEIWMGVIVGLYSPWREYSSDFDCFSQWLNLGNNFASASRIFDGGIKDKSIMGMIDPIKSITGLVMNSVAIAAICPAAYEEALDTKWYYMYNLASVKPRMYSQRSTKFADMDTMGKVFQILLYISVASSIISDSFDAYRNVVSDYYYYFAGFKAANAISTAFVFTDYIFNLGLIERVPTWVRFSDGEATLEMAEAYEMAEGKEEMDKKEVEPEPEPVDPCDEDPFFCF